MKPSEWIDKYVDGFRERDGDPIPFSRDQYEMEALLKLLDQLLPDVELCEKCGHIAGGEVLTPCQCHDKKT